MRIPSSLNDRNLYRDRKRLRREQSQATRRILRLVLALGVVLVIMRQAADPEIYRPFFPSSPQDLSAPPAGVNAQPAAPRQPDDSGAATATGLPLPTAGAPSGAGVLTADHWAREQVSRLEPAQRLELTRLLFEWRRRQSAPLQVSSGRGETPEIATDLWRELLGLLPSITELAAGAGDSGPGPAGQAFRQQVVGRLQAALDETYQQAVSDGAIWRAGDAAAFYRYLEIAQQPEFTVRFINSTPRARKVGVVPLMQQPEQYLGTSVWMYGRVARSVPVQAKPNDFGIDRYWEVWLRPDDGTERAVILYAPEVPEEIAAIGPLATLSRGPMVAIAGRFLKRRLFPAAMGPTESPAIVGRVWPPEPATTVPMQRSSFSYQTWWLVVGLASVIGVTVAGVVLWRSRVADHQLRIARSQRRRLAPQFLQQLADQSVSDSISNSGSEQ